jgi:hypothetical protein
MRLFLDTSILLAASGSAIGASREIFRLASVNGWVLVATPYVVEEVLRNLPELSPLASGEWVRLRQDLVLMDDVLPWLGRQSFRWPRTDPSCSARSPGLTL